MVKKEEERGLHRFFFFTKIAPNSDQNRCPLLKKKVGRKWAESGQKVGRKEKMDIFAANRAADSADFAHFSGQLPTFCPLLKKKVGSKKCKKVAQKKQKVA